MSSGNLVAITFVPEAVYDTTPTDSPDWETVRWTAESLNSQPEVATSAEVRSDRMLGDQFKTSIVTGGGFDFEFSSNTFDTLLDGVMQKAVAGGVWKVGTDDISYSITKEYADLTANHFMLYTGQRVAEFDLTFVHGSAVTGSILFAGASFSSASASTVGAGSVAPAPTTRVMNGVSDITGIEIGGVSFTGCIEEISLKVNNNLDPANCIGSDTPSDQILGTAEVTGTIKAFLSDVTIQWYTAKVQNQEPFDIRFQATDGTDTYEFDMPNCRINAPTPASGGLNTSVLIEADYVALYDAGLASNLVITKTP